MRILYPWEKLKHSPPNMTVYQKGEGIYLFDKQGKKYIDGNGGTAGNVTLGQGVEKIADAVASQMKQLTHVNPWFGNSEVSTNYVSRLLKYVPGDLKRIFFTPGGTLAVETALRFAMFYHSALGKKEKKLIISRDDAYHGSSYLTASCCSKKILNKHFDVEDKLVHHISSPNCYFKEDGLTDTQFCDLKVDEFEKKILELGPGNVAAFIAEPVLGAGGGIVPPKGYHKKMLAVCRKYDVLYISDEVVTGFGRLGHIFSSEDHFDIIPDIITVAKGITSGYVPCGAMLISESLMEKLNDEDHLIFSAGFTDSGHPTAMAAATAVLDIIEEDAVLEHVQEMTPYFQESFKALEALPFVEYVQGEGLLVSVRFKSENHNLSVADAQYKVAVDVTKHCKNLGLLVRPTANGCIIIPPLIIDKEQIDNIITIFQQAVLDAENELNTTAEKQYI